MKVYEYGSQSLLNISPMFDSYKDDLGGETNKINMEYTCLFEIY